MLTQDKVQERLEYLVACFKKAQKDNFPQIMALSAAMRELEHVLEIRISAPPVPASAVPEEPRGIPPISK